VEELFLTDDPKQPHTPSPSRQPKVSELFELSARRRDERLLYDLPETHLDGLEQLLRYLDDVESEFGRHSELMKVVVLVRRLRTDFETGLCEFLSGLDQATFDSMRDVMEIEYLLREFLHEPASIDQWLAAPDEDRWKLFGPGKLRQQHAKRVGVSSKNLLDTYEYRAHSASLHVSPKVNEIVQRGVSKSAHPELGAAFALADLLHHARDILFLLYELAGQATPPLRLQQDPRTDLPELRAAFDITETRFRNAAMLLDVASTIAKHLDKDNSDQ
jgi:hypothetical protein